MCPRKDKTPYEFEHIYEKLLLNTPTGTDHEKLTTELLEKAKSELRSDYQDAQPAQKKNLPILLKNLTSSFYNAKIHLIERYHGVLQQEVEILLQEQVIIKESKQSALAKKQKLEATILENEKKIEQNIIDIKQIRMLMQQIPTNAEVKLSSAVPLPPPPPPPAKIVPITRLVKSSATPQQLRLQPATAKDMALNVAQELKKGLPLLKPFKPRAPKVVKTDEASPRAKLLSDIQRKPKNTPSTQSTADDLMSNLFEAFDTPSEPVISTAKEEEQIKRALSKVAAREKEIQREKKVLTEACQIIFTYSEYAAESPVLAKAKALIDTQQSILKAQAQELNELRQQLQQKSKSQPVQDSMIGPSTETERSLSQDIPISSQSCLLPPPPPPPPCLVHAKNEPAKAAKPKTSSTSKKQMKSKLTPEEEKLAQLASIFQDPKFLALRAKKEEEERLSRLTKAPEISSLVTPTAPGKAEKIEQVKLILNKYNIDSLPLEPTVLASWDQLEKKRRNNLAAK